MDNQTNTTPTPPEGMKYVRTYMMGGYPQHAFIEDKSYQHKTHVIDAIQSFTQWVRSRLVVGYGESGIEQSIGFHCLPMKDALELADIANKAAQDATNYYAKCIELERQISSTTT